MVNATCAKLFAQLISSCQAKVGYGNAKAIVEAENILGLQITVVDTEIMTILNCIEQLEEDVPDQCVIPEIAAAMQYLREQVVIWCVVHDDVGAVVFLDNTMEGDDTWVR